jgi:hypothetical protein
MEKPPDLLLWLIALIITLLLFFIALEAKGQKEPVLKDLALIQDNSIMALSNPVYIKPIIYGTLLDCISYYESRHNPDAVGDAGECGQYQFMPSTFKAYCVDKYGLEDNIFDSDIQKRCADEMIQEDWNNVYQWTTAPRCL